MPKTHVTRNRTKITVLVAGLAVMAGSVRADGPGHSFTSLTASYTQELFGVTASAVASGPMGGVAFAPDGDVWGAECWGSQYHRFDRQAIASDGHGGTIHPESIVDVSTYAPAPVGCGLVNLPQQYLGLDTVFANTLTGLWPLEADTGTPILGGPLNSPSENAGNGRGIAVDPIANPQNHVVYAGMDCDPTLQESDSCTLWDYSPLTDVTMGFARFTRAATESIESVYFSPDGSNVFASYRDTAGTQGLLVIARPATLLAPNATDDAQVVARIPMSAMPQGVAFRAAGDFAVTLNEDGTMTRLVFPSASFTGAPAQSSFASGGFRGGLLQVGADGCIYAPQSLTDGGQSGVRFGDDAVADSDSVVRICGGFVPAPGVTGEAWGVMPGSISGSTFADWDRDGVRDAGEPGLAGVAISLTGPASDSAVTDGTGSYALADVAEGLYSVSAPATVGGLSGNPTPLSAQVAAGETVSGIDFPYTESTAPVCSATIQPGSPTRISFTLQDAGSGVRRVAVRVLTNAQASVNGGAALTAPATVDFPSPITGDVNVLATRSDAAQATNVTLDVVDAFGTLTSCASSVAGSTTEPPTPPTPPGDGETIRKEISGWGRHHVAVVDKLAGSMRYITIRNGRRGVHSVDIAVNHRWYHVRIRDGQVKSLDVARSLVAGKKNKIVLVGWGWKHDSAVVTISDRP